MAKRYLNRQWKQSMQLRLDYNNMMAENVGGGEGITEKELDSYKKAALAAFDKTMANKGKGWLGWTDLPYNQKEIAEEIKETAKDVRKRAQSFVVLGIGGSALGPIAVFQALSHLHYNELPRKVRKGPKFYVEDNVDPERMTALLDVVDAENTVFNVITKSGSTSETMTQYLVIYDILKKKLGEKAKYNIIATTSESKGNLIKLAKKEGFKTFYIPDGVGGRFSELCPVGLLPAAVLGIDINEMLAGAAYMDKICSKRNYRENPALINAVLQYICMQKGKNVSVMMPYADSLKYFADWYCQIWAESLGKETDNDGKTVNAGQTPVKSLGVTDQHSQVQLYTEGPFDKTVTFLAVEKYRSEVVIPEGCEDIPDVHFLSGHTMNELISVERFATEYALTKKHRINHTIYLPEVNAFTIGELIYYFEMETAFAGELLYIDAYNQPGVEEGKNATYALLGRKGYEEKKKELDAAPEKNGKYII
ncbi:MAG TPA: glucose-6-phosphate isomerase [Clostridiales bacterium]|nr:glucose-6-phosphate isomerase [Clostridiales bacterium]